MTNLVSRLCIILSLASAYTQATDDRPVARTTDVVDHAFGLTLPDPYRWMEGSKNAEFQAWLDAQSAYTRRHLDPLPTLPVWRQRLYAATADTVSNASYRLAGSRLFFVRRTSKGASRLYMRDGSGHERMIFDPNTMSADTSITTYEPSPNGRFVAINVDHAGDEISTIHVMDLNTGKWLSDRVDKVWGELGASWKNDSSGFTYTQMASDIDKVAGDPMQNMRVRSHKLGHSSAADPVVLHAGIGEQANETFIMEAKDFPTITLVPESNWIYAKAAGARKARRICITRSDSRLTRSSKWKCVADYDDSIYSQALRRNSLFLLSMKGSPNGRILALDLARSENPSLGDAEEILAQSGDSTIVDVVAARDALYAQRTRNGYSEILRIDYRTHKAISLSLPSIGNVREISADAKSEGIVLSLDGWTKPPAAYRYVPSTDRFEDLKLGTENKTDYGMIVTAETEAVSEDGTRVPLTVLHRKNVKLDESNPAILYGYGGYGISVEPRFSPLNLEWVKAGGIFAFAHVRGGGEKGDSWRVRGQGSNKHKGVEDLVACARELETLKYSNKKRIALFGRSMGGVLIGGAIAKMPHAFAAAVIGVGILNPARLLAARNGANQIAEVGDPGTAEGLKSLADMDPYLNIQRYDDYPATLLTIGINDGRVEPWESGKFAAKLLERTVGGKPVWIRADSADGHGVNASIDRAAAERADIYAFLDSQLSRSEYPSRVN